MPINLVTEDDLRAALRPHRVNPGAFEAAVRKRLEIVQHERAIDPLAGLSPLQRYVASLLPLSMTSGAKTALAVPLVPAAKIFKLLSFLAYPAICLFMLFGGAFISILKIRRAQAENTPGTDAKAIQQSLSQWWRRNWWGALLVYAATFFLSLIRATSLLFFLYIISFGLLVYVIVTLAKLGLGNRVLVALSCADGLIFLFSTGSMPGLGENEIHFIDPGLISIIFYAGVLVLLLLGLYALLSQMKGIQRTSMIVGFTPFLLFIVAGFPLLGWRAYELLVPVTQAQIKNYVESFDSAPYSSASWKEWEIPASWAIESKLDPDLSKPRQLLAQEIAGDQNPVILGCTFRTGLIPLNQIPQLKEYKNQRRWLFNDQYHIQEKRPLSLEQEDWVIRAAVLQNDLSQADRDYLAKRLNLNLEKNFTYQYATLKEALRATQLLAVIDRPVDVNRYRARIHDLLRKFHTTEGGGFQLAGGFKDFLNLPTGSFDSTSDAVQLMALYGIPDGLDLDWVRSYLRTKSSRAEDGEWIAPVTLDRLNHLPGITHPSWLIMLYYERSLVAAVILVALSIYATLLSPRMEIPVPAKPTPL